MTGFVVGTPASAVPAGAAQTDAAHKTGMMAKPLSAEAVFLKLTLGDTGLLERPDELSIAVAPAPV